MTTYSEVIDRTRRRLMTSQREGVNVLAAAVDADDVSLSMTHGIKFHDGTRLSIELETVHAVSVTGGGTGATVIRGMDGSVAASHATGTLVHITPTWTTFEIAQAVNDEVYSLSSPVNGLFRIRTVDFDYMSSQAGYELAGLQDFLDVWRVRYQRSGPELAWPTIPRALWRVDSAADTTDFPSGVQLLLREGGQPGQSIRVSYKASFDPLAALTDDVLTVSGVPASAHDILSLGAAIRLLSGLEAQRAYTTSQPDPGDLERVPPRTAIQALIPLVEQREERIREERSRLSRLFPEALS